jgi:hypothetical protein
VVREPALMVLGIVESLHNFVKGHEFDHSGLPIAIPICNCNHNRR